MSLLVCILATVLWAVLMGLFLALFAINPREDDESWTLGSQGDPRPGAQATRR